MNNTYVVINTESGEKLGETTNFSEAVTEMRAGVNREITTAYGAGRFTSEGGGQLAERYEVSPLSSSGTGKFIRDEGLTSDRLKGAYRSLVTLAARAVELGQTELADAAISCVLYTWCLNSTENGHQQPAPHFCLATKDPGGDLDEVFNDQVVVQMIDAQAGIPVTRVNPAVWLTLFKSGLLTIPPLEVSESAEADPIELQVLTSQLRQLAAECYILVYSVSDPQELYGVAQLIDSLTHVMLSEAYEDMTLYKGLTTDYQTLMDQHDPNDNPNEDAARATLRKLMEAEAA